MSTILSYYKTQMGFFVNNALDKDKGERAFLIRPSHTERVSDMALIPKFIDGYLIESYLMSKGADGLNHDPRALDLVYTQLNTYWDNMTQEPDPTTRSRGGGAHDLESNDRHGNNYKKPDVIYMSTRDINTHALRTGDVLFIAKGQHAGVLCFHHPAERLGDAEHKGRYVAHSTFYVLRPNDDIPKEERLKYGQALAAWLVSSIGKQHILDVYWGEAQDQSADEKGEDQTKAPSAAHAPSAQISLPVPWRISLKQIHALSFPPNWRSCIDRLSLSNGEETLSYVRALILKEHCIKIADENVRRALSEPMKPNQPYFFSEGKALEVTVEELLTGQVRSFDEPRALCISQSDFDLWQTGKKILAPIFEERMLDLIEEVHKEYGDYISFIPNSDCIPALIEMLLLMSIEIGHKVPYGPGSIVYDIQSDIQRGMTHMISDVHARRVIHSMHQSHSSKQDQHRWLSLNPSTPLESLEALLAHAQKLVTELKDPQ